MTTSTAHLCRSKRLPKPSVLERRLRAAAIAELVMQPDPNWRTFKFAPRWQRGFSLSIADSRQGEAFSAAVGAAGGIVAGFSSAHDDPKSPQVPIPTVRRPTAILRTLLETPQFDHGRRTFCLWWDGDEWRYCRRHCHCSVELLHIVADGAGAFRNWARTHYETDRFDVVIMQAFARRKPTLACIRKAAGKRTSAILDELATAGGIDPNLASRPPGCGLIAHATRATHPRL